MLPNLWSCQPHTLSMLAYFSLSWSFTLRSSAEPGLGRIQPLRLAAPSPLTCVTCVECADSWPAPQQECQRCDSRRRQINARTCGTAQPCRQDPFQERAALRVEFEKAGDRVQPYHRCLVWSYYSAFLGFSFLYLLMITNALLSHGNAAGIHNLCFHAAQMLRRWVPEDIHWSAAFQISKLLLKEHHKEAQRINIKSPQPYPE